MQAFTEQIKNNWVVLAFIASMILWYGDVNARLNSVEAEQVEQERLSDIVNEIRLDMAVVKSNVTTIKESLMERK